jgi:thiamine-monophosphate kinase
MAAIDPTTAGLLWTTDMLMDGVDFDSSRQSWRQIGRKALAVNLSDCAAMAVRPVAALCAVALYEGLAPEAAAELVAGAAELGARYDCPIVGGDTNSWAAPTVIAFTVAGRVPPGGRPVLRSGARPGDRVFVSGALGGSILGRHLTFEPRVELALEIARQCSPHALIDVSDGLSVDLRHIAEESGCAAIVSAAALDAVTHADAHALAARDGRPALEHALHDGEDFELVAVLAEPSAAAALRLGLHEIGRIEAGAGVLLEAADGRRAPLEPRGWEHFR